MDAGFEHMHDLRLEAALILLIDIEYGNGFKLMITKCSGWLVVPC